jgi:hypothetical protein
MRKKLDPKAKKGILVGYGPSSNIYRVFFKDLNRVSEVSDVKFNETVKKLIVLDDDEMPEKRGGRSPTKDAGTRGGPKWASSDR